jgi:hypothetical protein
MLNENVPQIIDSYIGAHLVATDGGTTLFHIQGGVASNITTVTAGTFGILRTSLDPRILQFALKYVF